MKKHALILTITCASFGLTLPPAHAQSGVRVKVPFDFVVADRTFPQGDYQISSLRDKVSVQNSQGKTVAVVLSNAVSGRTVGKTAQAVFECYERQCFLSELWSPTQLAGRQLLRSHWQTEVASKENAKHFALLARSDNHK